MKCATELLHCGKALLTVFALPAIAPSVLAAESEIIGFAQGHFAYEHTEDGSQNAFSTHRARLGAMGRIAGPVAYNIVFGAIDAPVRGGFLTLQCLVTL